jgi:ribonuclease BN (tRNA processing enzyme)
MKIVFLGTNGWYDSPTGNTICILIETGDASILLDAGNGLFKADRYIDSEKPVFLFISHLHLDHIIGLHLLNKFSFKQGLMILGQTGTVNALHNLFCPPFSMPFASLSYPVEIVELDHIFENRGFSVQTAALEHSVPTIGFRFVIGNKIIAYCPDTGYCDNAVELARQADLLMAECAYRPGEESVLWPHLNPESAARVALNAVSKRLALVHFDAFRYPGQEHRTQAQEAAKTIFPNTFAAVDDQLIEL